MRLVTLVLATGAFCLLAPPAAAAPVPAEVSEALEYAQHGLVRDLFDSAGVGCDDPAEHPFSGASQLPNLVRGTFGGADNLLMNAWGEGNGQYPGRPLVWSVVDDAAPRLASEPVPSLAEQMGCAYWQAYGRLPF